jgi:hypothetical protein
MRVKKIMKKSISKMVALLLAASMVFATGVSTSKAEEPDENYLSLEGYNVFCEIGQYEE